MNCKTKVPFSLKKIVLATGTALLASQASAGVITADGQLDNTYQLGFSVGFLDDKGNTIGDGKLFFGINSSDQTEFLYFQLPLNYVDNTYGTQSAVDWNKGHKFSDLYGSDRWGVTDKSGSGGFSWNGNSVTFDYIAGVCTPDSQNSTKCAKGSTITGYRSGGLKSILNDGALDKNDGSVNVDAGGVGNILEVATSLEYDFAQYGTTYLTDSPAMTSNTSGNISYSSTVAPNWIYDVGYEVQFKAGTFNPADWLDPTKATSLFDLGVVHASPSKTNYTSYDTPQCIVGCTPTKVPEPSSLWLLGLGLGALGWVSRKIRSRPPDTT